MICKVGLMPLPPQGCWKDPVRVPLLVYLLIRPLVQRSPSSGSMPGSAPGSSEVCLVARAPLTDNF